MRCRTGPIRCGNGWAFEVKWDGIRAIVDTRDRL
jgi:ATP-dependent DNA ligase